MEVLGDVVVVIVGDEVTASHRPIGGQGHCAQGDTKQDRAPRVLGQVHGSCLAQRRREGKEQEATSAAPENPPLRLMVGVSTLIQLQARGRRIRQ